MNSCGIATCDDPGCYLCQTVAKLPQPKFKDKKGLLEPPDDQRAKKDTKAAKKSRTESRIIPDSVRNPLLPGEESDGPAPVETV